MATVGMIYDYIDSFAPFDSQMGFDNAGLLIGSKDKEVKRVMVSLDASASAAEQAAKAGCQLLVTHHPIIFRPIKSLDARSAVYRLVSGGVDVICAHTNLDIAPGGVNERLAEVLGFEGFERLEDMNYCMAGTLPRKMSPAELAGLVLDRLGAEAVQLVDCGRPIKTAAIICGSGGGEVYDLMGRADVLITGEAKHHEMLDARDGGLSMVIAGHFQTERIIVEALATRLEEKFPDVEFLRAEEESPAAVYWNR